MNVLFDWACCKIMLPTAEHMGNANSAEKYYQRDCNKILFNGTISSKYYETLIIHATLKRSLLHYYDNKQGTVVYIWYLLSPEWSTATIMHEVLLLREPALCDVLKRSV